MSRIDPSVMTPTQPSALWTALWKAGSHDRADRHRAGIADDRRQIGKRTDQRLRRIADQATFRRDDFQRVADRRCVVARQRFKD
jgi:hypothetical protein